MEIFVAEYAGFCFGVKRAMEMVEKFLEDPDGPLYSLGPLIHNPQTVAALAGKGLRPVNSVEEAAEGTVVVRSHGISPKMFLQAEKKGLRVIDATCPFVQKAQRLSKQLWEDGYQVIVVGDEEHPEVAAIVGWSGDQALVIENADEAEALPHFSKIGVVAQTTQTEENFNQVVALLREKADDLIVYNTICHATRDRQEAALDLSKLVDLMFVVGGKNSSNTRKLARVCESTGTPTYHIESANELCPRWFHHIDRVGVTAGASTPDWIIEEVVEKMTEFKDDFVQEEEKKEEETSGTEPANPDAEAVSEFEDITDEDEYEVEEIGVSRPAEEETPVLADPETDENDTAVGESASQQVEAHLAENLKSIRRGEVISGTVVQIKENEVLVDIGGKSEGVIPLNELALEAVDDPSEVVSVGDKIDVLVVRVENEEGNPVVSKRRADRRKAWEDLEQAFAEQSELSGKVVEVVKGGLLVDVGVRGFVPASLVERGYVADLNQYVGNTLRLRVIELDRSKNKIVLSQKVILDEEYERKRQETWNTLGEGQRIKGVVRRLTDFGAFVDIGGVDGLLHVSEIAWGRVDHPGDVLSEGQEIEVYVLGVDREEGKVSLGLKQLQQNPWEVAEGKYPAGTVVEGKVLRIAPFGAFVEVEPGVEGLVHISQLADEHVEKTEDVVSVGDELQVKVLSVDPQAQRMSLSLRQAKEKEKKKEPKQPKKTEPAQETEYKNEEDSGGIKIGDLVGDIFNND